MSLRLRKYLDEPSTTRIILGACSKTAAATDASTMPNTGQPSASIPGSGNTVVQIVGNHNNVTIAGAVALRLHDYLSDAFAKAPADPSRQGEPGYTATGRREISILNPFNRESLKLQGRADLLLRLWTWLKAPGSLSVHVLIGGGGRGKTRLAVELAAEARAMGWTAGFAGRENLDVFRRAGCRTAWEAPTLVIIDYAAVKSNEIATWLREMVHDAGKPDGQPLRLMLLERLGGEGVAWWKEVFGGADPEGIAARDTLAQGAPLTVGSLSDPADRYLIFASAFRQACDDIAPQRDTRLDEELGRISLDGGPLLLAMFALLAARNGIATAQAMPASQIAFNLAAQELQRVRQVWEWRGLSVGLDRPLHAHLAALATLCEGLSEDETHHAIARESIALRQAIRPEETEAARLALHTALPGDNRGVAAVLPDILGSALLIEAWKEDPEGRLAIKRTIQQIPERPMRTLLRVMRDFPDHTAPREWVSDVAGDAHHFEALRAAAHEVATRPYDYFDGGATANEWSREALKFIESYRPRPYNE